MMKKLYLVASAMMVMSAQAQDKNVNLDTYSAAQLATEDLNGTARYVGMGGAMDALGAEISTIGSNPAGIGVFRKCQVSGSMGVRVQEDGKSFHDGSKVHASFDQLGVVLSTRMGATSYLNFAFNFHKSRDFNHVLSAAAKSINGSSQNAQTVIKGVRKDLDKFWGESQVDKLYLDHMLKEDANKNIGAIKSSDYEFDRAQTGYIGEYDFNISGNINNRVYLGVTLGIKSVHYNSYSEHFEHLTPLTTEYKNLTSVLMSDDQRITGTGFDIKFGAIIRPIEESPFRFGLSVATPTWYSLKSSNTTRIGDVGQIGYDVKFRLNTPWRFGVSAGHTIGSKWALGIGYEYADYTTNDMRAITNYGYDRDGFYNERSTSDNEMKRSTEAMLRGVHTLKAGVEFRPDASFALRLGYNYVSPIYKQEAYRDQTLNSPGVYMASTTDYTNWKDTHRLTAGVGFNIEKFRIDVAYQYSATKGDFYPYMSYISGKYIDSSKKEQVMVNEATAVSVKNIRHQLLCTLSYTF